MDAVTPPPIAEVSHALSTAPPDARGALYNLRSIIYSVASDVGEIGGVQESLKWGEPAYSTIAGSTVRLGWKAKNPNAYALYFHCQTSLVETFRTLYGPLFNYEGNRAIVFRLGDPLPETELRHCILLALTYHKRKRLPLLGANLQK